MIGVAWLALTFTLCYPVRITHISFFFAVCQLSRSLLCATADEVVLCWYQGGFFAIPRVVLIAHEVFYFHLHFSYNSSQKWPLQAQIKPRFVNKPDNCPPCFV